MEFQVGVNVGGYDILDIISSSKTEVVYRVRNPQAKRIEVMRVLPLSVAGDQERTERFLREMRVHAKLSHPNILEFYGAAELERRLVMTTEAIEGVTLAERLKLGPLPWKEAVALMRQALAALAHAHAQGIVHRDVKPQNMMITPDGALKLADFGLAKAATSPQVTQVGAVVGTLQYISPEQVRGTATVDARSDLYSVGLVLYEAVAGKTPFDYKSQFEIMVAQVNETPKPPSALNPAVPPQLDAVILNAVAKNPDERFQTADEFSAALERVKAMIEQPAQAAAIARVALELPPAEPNADGVPVPAVSPIIAPPAFVAPPPIVIDEPAAVPAAVASEAPEAAASPALTAGIAAAEVAAPVQASDVPVEVNGQSALLAAAIASEAPVAAETPEPVAEITAADVTPLAEVSAVGVPVNGQSALLAAADVSEAPVAAETPAAPATPPVESTVPVPVNGRSALLSAVDVSEKAVAAATSALAAEIPAAEVLPLVQVSDLPVAVNGRSALLAAVEPSEAGFAAATPAPVAEIAAAPVMAPAAAPAVALALAINGQSAPIALALASDAPVAIAIPAPAAEIPVAAAQVSAIPTPVNGQSAPAAVALDLEAPVPADPAPAAARPGVTVTPEPPSTTTVAAPAAAAAVPAAENGVAPAVASLQTAIPAPEFPDPAAAAAAVAAPDPPRVQSSTTVQPIEDTAVLAAEEPVSKDDSRRWDAGLLYLFAATVIMLVAAALTALLQTPQ